MKPAIRAAQPLLRRAAPRTRLQYPIAQRTYAAGPASPRPPPPNPHTKSPPSRTGTYYSNFGSPLLKCFLGALFTYQLAYYGWLKLEAMEEAHDNNTEIARLQDELRQAVAARRDSVAETMEDVGGKVMDGVKATGAVREVVKGGWWPW